MADFVAKLTGQLPYVWVKIRLRRTLGGCKGQIPNFWIQLKNESLTRLRRVYPAEEISGMKDPNPPTLLRLKPSRNHQRKENLLLFPVSVPEAGSRDAISLSRAARRLTQILQPRRMSIFAIRHRAWRSVTGSSQSYKFLQRSVRTNLPWLCLRKRPQPSSPLS